MADIEIPHGRPAIGLHPINWSAAIWASVIGGLVFAALEVSMVPLFQDKSPWAPLHMIGAIALGPNAMTSPDTFDLGVIGTAVVVHMALAILYGIILAFVIARLDMGMAIAIGAIYGLALYIVNFYVFTKWFPWFADARDWISIFTHLVQGGLWGCLYRIFDRRTVTETP
jgi:hypothetical protein